MQAWGVSDQICNPDKTKTFQDTQPKVFGSVYQQLLDGQNHELGFAG